MPKNSVRDKVPSRVMYNSNTFVVKRELLPKPTETFVLSFVVILEYMLIYKDRTFQNKNVRGTHWHAPPHEVRGWKLI